MDNNPKVVRKLSAIRRTLALILLSAALGSGFFGILMFFAIAYYSGKNPQSSPNKSDVIYKPSYLPQETPSPIPSLAAPVEFKEDKSKSVIAEYANLYQSADTNSAIAKTLFRGAAVKIIKQKGVWFLVSDGKSKGWLYGNTIGYGEVTNTVSTYNESLEKSYSTPSTSSTSSSSVPVYDYRPKTVYVQGYTRKNGTYVAPYSRRSPR
jgi:hypothetical protein